MGEFLGLTADAWSVVATFFGGFGLLFGLLFGAYQITREQERLDARRYLIEDGVRALKEGIDRWLELMEYSHRMTGTLLAYVHKTLQEPSFSLIPEDIPKAIPEPLPTINTHGVSLAVQLTGCLAIHRLTSNAAAAMHETIFAFEIGIRHQVIQFYKNIPPQPKNLASWYGDAENFVSTQMGLTDAYTQFSSLLGAAISRAQELHLASRGDLKRLHQDREMISICEQLQALDEITNAGLAATKNLNIPTLD